MLSLQVWRVWEVCLKTWSYVLLSCRYIAKLSLNSTQLRLRVRLALFPAIPATHPPNQPANQESSKMELQILQLNTLNTLIKKFKYLPSSVSTQFQLQLSLNSTPSQLNSTATQTTKLGTTQLKLVLIYFLWWKRCIAVYIERQVICFNWVFLQRLVQK